MNEEEALLRKELRRFRGIATSLQWVVMGDEALYSAVPEFQAEAIIEGFGYRLPSVLLVRTVLVTGELQLKDEVCPDCGCIVTEQEQRRQKIEKTMRILKEKFDHLISGTCEDCFRKWALSIKRRQPARPPRGVELRAELTTEERLNREVGDLFPNGFSADILSRCIEYDGKYSLKELRTMCVEAGLSPSGHKKLLAAKLLAHQKRGESPS